MEFERKFLTDVYAEQRGLEQLVHEVYSPRLNRINPVSPRNQRLDQYLDSAYNFLDIFGVG